MHRIYLCLDDYVIVERETGETRNSFLYRNRRINSAGYEFTLSHSSLPSSFPFLSLSLSLSLSRSLFLQDQAFKRTLARAISL